jgi:two-component system, OmpR family, sensor histidine kinase KdpD
MQLGGLEIVPFPDVPTFPGPWLIRGARRLRLDLRSFELTVGIMAATTLAAFLVRPARGEVSGALIFVLGITLAGAMLGLGAALVAAAGGFLLYNFYFAEPVLTFRLDTISDFAPLIIFNLSAVISGILAGRVRDQAEAAAAANNSLGALLQISGLLQSALRFEDIERALTSPPARAAGVCLPPAEKDATAPREGSEAAHLPEPGEDPAGYCVESGGRTIRITIERTSSHRGADLALGSALANLVALAAERASLSEAVAEAEAAARTESLKSALLSSVSHDLRTPLATISASASSLIDYGDRLERDVADNLLRSIVEESERLNRFTANLLQMTRLEAGQPLSSAQIVSVSDMLSVAVRRLRPRAGKRRIERHEPEDCLVLADAALFELALLNILENAVLYSDDGSRIAITLIKESDTCVVEIADEGRGIPKAELGRVFDRFYRVDASEQMPRGTGLGLAIAQGFVRACGGTIEAQVPGLNRRGTRIRIRLPIAAREIG